MGLYSRLFGSKRIAPNHATATQTRSSLDHTALPDRDASRRELLVMAVQDTLRKNGIPPAWVGAEALTATTAGRERGMHLRLILRHWEPKLLVHAMAVQNSVRARIALLDPLSSAWMAGISWKLDVPEDVPCAPLPDAGYWQRLISNQPMPMPDAQPKAATDTPRSVLERVFGSASNSAGKARYERADFSPTQPMK